VQVLHQRLACLPGRVFAPAAIELCSRKVGAGGLIINVWAVCVLFVCVWGGGSRVRWLGRSG
jgi:hypothetical protein